MLAGELIANGLGFQFRAQGRSMLPVIGDGEILHIAPAELSKVRRGDIVLFKGEEGFKAHRVIRKAGNLFVTRGDSGTQADAAIRGEQILGAVVAKECAETGRVISLQSLRFRINFLVAELRKR